MKKPIILLLLAVALFVSAVILLKVKQSLNNPANCPKPYHGGQGGGYSSAEWSGKLDLR